jgi:hypothetical protein
MEKNEEVSPFKTEYLKRLEQIKKLKITWRKEGKNAVLKITGDPETIDQLVFYPQRQLGDFIAFVVTNYYLKNIQWSMKDRVKPIPVDEGQATLTGLSTSYDAKKK